ncbi:MAG: hypothetical protein ACD_37C00664G0004 [uncultured bacterium]|nr:MAG: hypothetical protein ACD_37C00664G0004 [uncultured bacterium]
MTDIFLGFILFLTLLVGFLILLRIATNRSPAVLLCLTSLIVYVFGLIGVGLFNFSLKFFEFSASYWFFSFSLMMVFFAIYKSISLRMMLNLQIQPASLEEIFANYIEQESYKARLNILIKNGFAEKSNLGYQPTLKGWRYARFIAAIQKLFNIQQSG